LHELRICGDGGEGKIGGANFGRAVGLESKHGSVGGGAEIRGGVIRYKS
jgi:hypothetical protein